MRQCASTPHNAAINHSDEIQMIAMNKDQLLGDRATFKLLDLVESDRAQKQFLDQA
jgi:hypothetical protein